MIQDYSTYRILADLRACAGPVSNGRGIDNLSRIWLEQTLVRQEKREIFALVDSSNKTRISALPSNRHILYSDPPIWQSERNWRGGEADTLSDIAYSSFIAPWRFDVVHVAHVFEDYAVNAYGLPFFPMRPGSQVVAATVYDFIPLVFPDHYFQNRDYKNFYYFRLQWLRKADLLFAISEATRQDAINLVGINPANIVVVPPCIDYARFKPALPPEDSGQDFFARCGIHRPYVLYVGGDEYRKNVKRLIRAFALLPQNLREKYQLVLAFNITEQGKEELAKIAGKAGLGTQELVFTGFVPEADLPHLYQRCDLFVFPSLYEGLGMPVLEAMACGAPVIAGDNSSLKELVDDRDARFEATSEASIARAISKALSDRDYNSSLRKSGIKKIGQLSRQNPGKTILEAYDAALARKRESGLKFVQAGGLPLKRLAVLTPLPPEQSGIADYSARFLPYLGRYFEIDVYTTCSALHCPEISNGFRVYSASDFEKAASSYDFILYELGNSDFHSHMFSLLEKYPGVVTLHDAFLSGVLNWMGRDVMLNHALYSHASKARRILLPSRGVENADYEAIVQLPCSKKALENAVGVISHTRWNLELARKFYSEGLPSSYRIIPQAMKTVQPLSQQEKAKIKAKLSFPPDAFIIASFGHVDYTKMDEIILDAFLASKRFQKDHNTYLVFVGRNCEGEYGKNLADHAAASNGRMRITGFVSEEAYHEYLSITDVAVQLRRNFRGCTSASLLESLAYGISSISNKYDNTLPDFERITLLLSEQPGLEELLSAMETLASDSELRKKLGNAGLDYVRQNNGPGSCAAQYALAIHDFYEQYKMTAPARQVINFGHYLNNESDVGKAAEIIACQVKSPIRKSRLYIDVTFTANHDGMVGVSRCVTELVKSLYCFDVTGLETVAVELKDGQLVRAVSLLAKLGLFLPDENTDAASVDFAPGDILLMLDSSWCNYADFIPVFERLRFKGGKVVTVVHDILPIILPESDIVAGGAAWFEGWLRQAISQSDMILCVSQAGRDILQKWGKTQGCQLPLLSWWHHGANFLKQTVTKRKNNLDVKPAIPYLLIVGTIAPHKNQELALEAFIRLWQKGFNLSLCIAGKEGWLVDALMTRIRQLNICEKHFTFMENPSDHDLAQLYANAAGLLFPSKGEGFGLPIIEAAHYGLPILCSDIPVFHEIAGEHAFYLDISSVASLANGIERWWNLVEKGEAPSSNGIPILTWEQSAAQLLAALNIIKNNFK